MDIGNLLDKIESLAKESVIDIEYDFMPTTNSGKFEIYMFYMYFGFSCLNQLGKIDTSTDEAATEYLRRLYFESSFRGIDWELVDMVNLYKERTKNYLIDIDGLKNSKYPETKQYLPAYTFTVMFYDPLIPSPEMSWADLDGEDWDMEKYEQLSNFLGAFCNQNNWTIKHLEKE